MQTFCSIWICADILKLLFTVSHNVWTLLTESENMGQVTSGRLSCAPDYLSWFHQNAVVQDNFHAAWPCLHIHFPCFLHFPSQSILLSKCIRTKYVNFSIRKPQIKLIYMIIRISEHLKKNHNYFMKGAISKGTKIFNIHKSCSPKCHSELLKSPS